ITKSLSIVSDKNYNLSGNEDFVIFLTSKLITCFIDGFTLKMKSSQLLIYSMEVNIYIGFETLKMKCTQYGICGQVAFKNASTLVFSKSGGRAAVFGRAQKKCWGLPPDRIPPRKVRGGYLTSSVHNMLIMSSWRLAAAEVPWR